LNEHNEVIALMELYDKLFVVEEVRSEMRFSWRLTSFGQPFAPSPTGPATWTPLAIVAITLAVAVARRATLTLRKKK
jgi:hypothetical protein